MNFDSYIEETRTNAIEEIPQYYSTKKEALDNTENIYDNLFVSDSVTGNGSGSYTFDREKAKELIQDAMYDDRFISRMDDMGFSSRGPPGSLSSTRKQAMTWKSSGWKSPRKTNLLGDPLRQKSL